MEAGSRVPASIYFEQSTWLLKVQNSERKSSRKKLLTSLNINSSIFQHKFTINLPSDRGNKIYFNVKALRDSCVLPKVLD